MCDECACGFSNLPVVIAVESMQRTLIEITGGKVAALSGNLILQFNQLSAFVVDVEPIFSGGQTLCK